MDQGNNRLTAIPTRQPGDPEGSRSHVKPLETTRLVRAKAAYTTRRVPFSTASHLIEGDVRPSPGDLVLARVERLGQHSRIELGNGRRAHLFPGDEIILCYGHRYAPDQFEGEVPESLAPCHMVAAGGIAASAVSRHAGKKAATRITPLGLLGDAAGRPMNIADHALPRATPEADLPLTLAAVGTSMNAGKTTTAAYLIRGLARAGLKVGAAKITGTGKGGRILKEDVLKHIEGKESAPAAARTSEQWRLAAARLHLDQGQPEEALQLHGGIGMTAEHLCHRYLKRALLDEHLGREIAVKELLELRGIADKEGVAGEKMAIDQKAA